MVRQAMVSWAVCVAAAGCSKPAAERPVARGLAWDSLIEGKVVDDVSGATLAGTTVSVSGGGLGEAQRAVTGPDGEFSFGPVPAGRYSLTVMYKDLVVQRWVIVDARTPVSLRVDTRRASGDAVWQQDGCDIPRCPGRKRPEIVQPRRGRRR